MATVTKDLGIATAYGYAKSKGYTGTEDEFAQLMANLTTAEDNAEASASDAEAYGAGTRGGTAVPSTDGAYQNNAKYYKEQAQQTAQSISQSAQQIATNTSDIADLKEDLSDLATYTGTESDANISLIDGNYIQSSNGYKSGANANFAYSNYIDIEGYDKIRITMPVFTATMNVGLAFYTGTTQSTFLKGEPSTTGSSVSYKETYIDIPEGATHFRTSWFSTTGEYADISTSFSCALIKSGAIDTLTSDVQDLTSDVQDLTSDVQDLNILNYVSLSMFETLGAIGDSYTSGGIYGVTGVASGAHLNISWPQVLARKCGLVATNYSRSGIDISTWLSDANIGLPKLQADTPLNLYVITMGINTEKSMSDPTQNADIGTVADINTTDPTQNADTFCGHYGRMVSGIIEHAPHAKIILVKPLITSAAKMAAIGNIAELFQVPVINMNSESYYKTDFYRDNLSTSHPIALTYSGMALAFERQIKRCMVDNVDYFKDYTGQTASTLLSTNRNNADSVDWLNDLA